MLIDPFGYDASFQESANANTSSHFSTIPKYIIDKQHSGTMLLFIGHSKPLLQKIQSDSMPEGRLRSLAGIVLGWRSPKKYAQVFRPNHSELASSIFIGLIRGLRLVCGGRFSPFQERASVTCIFTK